MESQLNPTSNPVRSPAESPTCQQDPLLDGRQASGDDSAVLLIFTLGAAWEARRRKLLPAGWSRVERSLHRACLNEVLEAGRSASCRLAVSSPLALDLPVDVERLPQTGENFGTRLRRAYAATQATSTGPVVLVGSDLPGLNAAHLRRTLEILTEDPERVVIGPSPDGGFYLLASNRPLDRALTAVRWCCKNTLRSLRRALRREGCRVTLLPPLRDLDHRADLEALLAVDLGKSTSLAWRVLVHWLIEALRAWRQPLAMALVPVPRQEPRTMRRGRAPPRHHPSI